MGKKKLLMLVDDENDFLKMIKLNLEETGKYDVVTLSKANIWRRFPGNRQGMRFIPGTRSSRWMAIT